jgi:hypothetical protein
MAHIHLDGDRIRIGKRLAVSFQRTLRIPDDGRTYPLPPGLGRFPVRRAADYTDRLPLAWRDDFFVPMYRREALWIGFEGTWWKPNAVKVGIGGIDAVSGDCWDEELRHNAQNYLVVPDQPWLDGINSGDKIVRQFVAMPTGEGYSVEVQITGRECIGGVQLIAFEPKPGRFPDKPPPHTGSRGEFPVAMTMPQTMGIAAGGTMRQKIYPDKYGIDVWNLAHRASVFVHLISAAEFHAITGEETPPTPVDIGAYTAAGLPWFQLYDDEEGDVAAAETLARIKSIREIERRSPDKSVGIKDSQISRLRRKK